MGNQQLRRLKKYSLILLGRVFYMEKRIHDFIPYIKDYYTINDLGEVYSDNSGRMKTRNRAGTEYQIINFMTNDGKKKTFRVHRLVMMAFKPIENPELMEVNHLDGNKKNNQLNNLEWCTSSENQQHAYKHNLQKSQKGKSKPISKRLTEKDVKQIWSLRKQGLSYKKIGDQIGTSSANVAKIIKGETWSSVKFND